MNPLVSIIIPVYNVRPYLTEALNSVIGQTYSNLEIIIIDDGSNDGSEKICEEYITDKRVRLIHQENKGLSAARNVGLKISSGEYIAFLDPDDSLKPSFISSMVTAMKQEDSDLVISKFTVHYTGKIKESRGKLKRKIRPSIEAGNYEHIPSLRALCAGKLNYNVWNKLYKKELWEGLLFSEGHVFEDAEVAYKILDRCEKVCVIDDVQYLYRRRANSITDTTSWKNIEDQLLSKKHIMDFIKDRTPEVFSVDDVKRKESKIVIQLMNCYGRSFDIPDEEGKREKLRRIILQEYSPYGIKNSLDYRMIAHCPKAFAFYFKLKRSIREMAKRLL